MHEENLKLRKQLVDAAKDAVKELIKIAKEKIQLKKGEDIALAADRLKNAAAAKKLAVFDALEILSRIDEEEKFIAQANRGESIEQSSLSFAERRAKGIN